MKNKEVLNSLLFLCFIFAWGNNLFAQGEIDKYLTKKDSLEKVNKIYIIPKKFHVSPDSVINFIDNMPNFGVFRDNYFILGAPLNRSINRHTLQIKYQLSVRHRLTKTILPFNSFLFLTYTQKSFWNIFEESSPFTDNNYNPGVNLAAPIFYKKQLFALLTLGLEHESNGRDSIFSRSWNYLSASGMFYINPNFNMQIRSWIGLVSKNGENPDYLDYRGNFLVATNFRTWDDKYRVSIILNPILSKNRMNTTLEFNYRTSSKMNQYLFFQIFSGYADSMMNYDKYSFMFRVGMCIKPDFITIF